MVIDEWGGWVWACFPCEVQGRKATDEEIDVQHNQQIHNGPHGQSARAKKKTSAGPCGQ